MELGAVYQVADPPTTAVMTPLEQVPDTVTAKEMEVTEPVTVAFGLGEKTRTEDGEPLQVKVGVTSKVAAPGTAVMV